MPWIGLTTLNKIAAMASLLRRCTKVYRRLSGASDDLPRLTVPVLGDYVLMRNFVSWHISASWGEDAMHLRQSLQQLLSVCERVPSFGFRRAVYVSVEAADVFSAMSFNCRSQSDCDRVLDVLRLMHVSIHQSVFGTALHNVAFDVCLVVCQS